MRTEITYGYNAIEDQDIRAAVRLAYEKVNNSIEDKRNCLTERLNDLQATEDHLKQYELHNHYY